VKKTESEGDGQGGGVKVRVLRVCYRGGEWEVIVIGNVGGYNSIGSN
jgi:hypothetical protein